MKVLFAGMIACLFRLVAGNAGFCVRENLEKVDEAVSSSDVIIAGYTRSVLVSRAEFLVVNIFKGEKFVDKIFESRKPTPLESALNRRMLGVAAAAGKPSGTCPQSITVGETYILFLKLDLIEELILNDRSAVLLYSRNKEEVIRNALENTVRWSEWNACSKSCGGGVQKRRRMCSNCQSVEGIVQQRSCNTFPCIGLTDVLDVVGLRKTRLHPADRPTAYRLVSKGSWSTSAAVPPGFPEQFALLMAVRSTSDHFSGFLFRLLHKKLEIQLGVLFSGETVTLVLPKGSKFRFKTSTPLKKGEWFWMSFAVQRNMVIFFLNCKPSGSLARSIKKLPQKDDSHKTVTYVVGNLGARDRQSFQVEWRCRAAATERISKRSRRTMQRVHGDYETETSDPPAARAGSGPREIIARKRSFVSCAEQAENLDDQAQVPR